MPIKKIKRKDLVQVVRPNLMSTGWFGEVRKVFNENGKDKAEVHFRRQNRTLTFNVDSLKKAVNPNKEPEKKPKVKVIETTELEYENGNYCLVFKDKDGKTEFINRSRLNDNTVDQEAQTFKLYGRTHNFEDLLYIYRCGTELTFHRPHENDYPFYILREDVYNGFVVSFNENRGKIVIEMGNGHSLLPEWLEDINAIKPKFKKIRHEIPAEEGDVDFKINKLTREWNKSAKKKGLSFGLVVQNKKTGEISGDVGYGRACHAMVNSWAGRKDPKSYDYLYGVQLISSAYFQKYDSILPYMDWVMNRSPWSRYILTKTWEEALDTGIRIRMDIPANALMCTFYATRYPTEYMGKVRDWKKAVDAGMNENAAYFYAETAGLKSQARSLHTLLDTYSMDIKCLKAFIRGDKGKVEIEPLHTGRRYSKVSIHHGTEKGVPVTALEDIRKMDIFEGEKKAAFGGGGVKVVQLEKAVAVMNKIAEEANGEK